MKNFLVRLFTTVQRSLAKCALDGHSNVRINSSGLLYVFLMLFMSLCYTILRYKFNFEWHAATQQQIYELIAAPPFGKRVLISLLSRPFVFCGLTVHIAFFLLEILSTFFIFSGLYHLFSSYVNERHARLMTVGMIFVLPLVFLLHTPNPWLFPWDTPAIAFIVWGVFFLLQGWWRYSVILIFFATLNRESAILLPMMFLALCIDRMPPKKILAILLAQIFVYFGTSWLITLTLADNLPFYEPLHGFASFSRNGVWRIVRNWEWLNASPQNYLILLSTMGWMPIFNLILFKYIPRHLKRFMIVALFYFVLMAFVGNFVEPRVFGEITAMLYISFMFGCYNYCVLSQSPIPASVMEPGNIDISKIINYLEIFAVVIVIVVAFAGYNVLKCTSL